MRGSTTQLAVMLAGVLAVVATTVMPLQPVFGEGGARRDVVRQEEQNHTDALEHANEAVEHGKQGHTEALVAHAETALQQALNAGKDYTHVDEGIAHLIQREVPACKGGGVSRVPRLPVDWAA